MSSSQFSGQGLQPVPPDADRARLAELEAQLTKREGELSALKGELLQLQTRYLDEIGSLYTELSTLEAAVINEEVRQGLRPPAQEIPEEDEASGESAEAPDFQCATPGAPSDGLKRLFRDLAKTIHPDLALDEQTRYRRHSLMAEANRAYADRDEDRLRLIMRAWRRSPEAVSGDDSDADRQRVDRKLAAIDEQLVAIEAEFVALRAMAIFRLKRRIDEARSQGWDLFAEMILQVKREIARATARLKRLGTG